MTTAAPQAVAIRLTREFDIQRWRVSTVAPSRLSSSAPVIPPTKTIGKRAWPETSGAKDAATEPMSAAPPAAPAVPSAVTAPESPWQAIRHVVMRRGSLVLQRPISVPHVSAVAAAMAPAAAPNAAGHPTIPCASAASAAIPPFAATWSHRRPPKSAERRGDRLPGGSSWVSADAVAKNVPASKNQAHPPSATSNVPMRVAAQAPDGLSALRR